MASADATPRDSVPYPLANSSVDPPNQNPGENPEKTTDASTADASDALDSADLPPPPVPDTPMDYSLGREATVVTTPDEEPRTAKDLTWLESVLECRGTLSSQNPLTALRAQADQDVTQLKVPTRKMEPWRFTDLRSLYASRYLKYESNVEKLAKFDARDYIGDSAGVVLVFVDGVFHEELSLLQDDSGTVWKEAGGYFGSIDGYKGNHEELRGLFVKGELGTGEEGGLFPCVGHAIGTDAAVIEVPEGFEVSKPVAVLFVGTTGETPLRASVCAARLAVLAKSGSKISLSESHISVEKEGLHHLTFGMTTVRVAEDANVEHFVFNDLCLEAHLLAHIHADVHDDGQYICRTIGVGSKVGRFDVGVDLVGSGSRGVVMGTLISDGYQVLDIHSRIHHDALRTTSEQLQKNIAADHARSIFRGRIVVSKNGAGTESSQLCRSMLLSNKATVDAMPVLEIANDDVACTHGATVSDLDGDQLIYCRCRGLSHEQAQVLLILGFTLDVLGDCPVISVRKRIQEKVEFLSAKLEERNLVYGGYSSI